MGDIRFKIQGDRPPFTVEVEPTSASVVICSTVFEFSGQSSVSNFANNSCVIIGGLSENNSFRATVTDSIGNVISEIFNTPSAPPSKPDVNKTISLEQGIVRSPVSNVNYIDKTDIIINPDLQFSENFEVQLCAIPTISVPAGEASIIVYCNNTAVLNTSNSTSNSKWIPITSTDKLEYTMSVVTDETVTNTSTTSLEITGVRNLQNIDNVYIGTPNRFELSNTTTQTTTTTTTLAPGTINVSFSDVTNLIKDSENSKSQTVVVNGIDSDEVIKLDFSVNVVFSDPSSPSASMGSAASVSIKYRRTDTAGFSLLTTIDGSQYGTSYNKTFSISNITSLDNIVLIAEFTNIPTTTATADFGVEIIDGQLTTIGSGGPSTIVLFNQLWNEGLGDPFINEMF